MIRRLSLLTLVVAASLLPHPVLALKDLKATPQMQNETTELVSILENMHFRNKELSEENYQHLIPDFMGELDAQRLFFLASDEAALVARYRDRLPNDLHFLGNLDVAFETFKLYVARVTERVAWVKAELARDFDFAAPEEFAWDRSKAPWPSSPAEADDLWRKRLKFELLQDVLNDKTIEVAKDNLRRRYDRLLRNLDDVDAEEVQEIYLSSLTRMYDPHTAYMSPSTLEDFSMQMRLSLVGIGAQLSQDDGMCVVRELIPGGPADIAKSLRPNDKIVAVAQEDGEPVDVIDMKLRKVVDLIRGEKGTKVRLTIIPADAADTSVRREITIVRDVVKLNASRASASIHQVPDGDSTLPVGVISLPAFYGDGDDEGSTEPVSATRDVAELITKLQAAGVRGLVLDLRQNGGGLLSEAVDLAGLFIAQGPVVQVRNSLGRVDVRADEDRRVTYDGPLVVLTSRYSASASEIVAGALQNYGRAIVIGDSSTHGKGTVQAILEMNSRRLFRSPHKSGAAKMTIQKFYLPNGASTQNQGVVPDIVLPSIEEFLPIGESDLPNALAWDTIPPTRFDGAPLDSRFVRALRDASKNRQLIAPEFDYLGRNINWFKEREERKTVSLNLEERKAQKKANDDWRAEMKKMREELAKLNFPSTEVKLEGVENPAKEPTAPPLDPEDEKDDAGPRIDVHLRESLRVLADAIRLWHQPQLWQSEGRPLTASLPNRFAPVP